MVAPKAGVFGFRGLCRLFKKYLSTCEWFPSQEESRAERYRRSRSPSFGKARGDDFLSRAGSDLRDFLDFGRLVGHKIYISLLCMSMYTIINFGYGGNSKMLGIMYFFLKLRA